MILDIGTIIVMVGVTCGGLSVLTFIVWLSHREERFLLIWSIATLILVGSSGAFGFYEQTPSLLIGWIAASTTVIGAIGGWMTAMNLRRRRPALWGGVARFVIAQVAIAAPALAGLPGTMVGAFNIVMFLSLMDMASVFWSARKETRLYMTSLAVLATIIGTTFLLCGIHLFLFEEPDFLGIPQTILETLNGIVTVFGLTAMGALLLTLVHERIANQHRTDAMTDALTGLLNRRALLDIGNASGTHDTVAVIIFDLDHFKMVNDTHGHAVGDLVLRRFTVICRQALRATDLAARIGGEEFAVVLPGTGEAEAILVADRIRRRFQKEEITTESGTVQCTVSAGVHASPHGSDWHLNELLLGADLALYDAKNGGRNQVRWAEPSRKRS
ncbi:diguanylate cyclase (GGDEF)-like protein [Amorphus suaedae]